jgi:hypothetical protein
MHAAAGDKVLLHFPPMIPPAASPRSPRERASGVMPHNMEPSPENGGKTDKIHLIANPEQQRNRDFSRSTPIGATLDRWMGRVALSSPCDVDGPLSPYLQRAFPFQQRLRLRRSPAIGPRAPPDG